MHSHKLLTTTIRQGYYTSFDTSLSSVWILIGAEHCGASHRPGLHCADGFTPWRGDQLHSSMPSILRGHAPSLFV
jgi:hypothetical protein